MNMVFGSLTKPATQDDDSLIKRFISFPSRTAALPAFPIPPPIIPVSCIIRYTEHQFIMVHRELTLENARQV